MNPSFENPNSENPNSGIPIYQGQFGSFTITEQDRQGVKFYRLGLMMAAFSVAIATLILVLDLEFTGKFLALTVLYILLTLGLGMSLWFIHIYMAVLHRLLQGFWLVGTVAAIALALLDPAPLATTLYHQPLSILGIGFTFAALTGIYFKEAFCFDRLETKGLTAIVPILLLGHLLGILPIAVEKSLAIAWAILFLIFAFRKAMQNIPDDIGDKSVFEYLHQKRSEQRSV
ncbi:MAG: DUF2301 domain-containing membrane protein [Synechococcales bacterium]|nr:DUF2301 domain-containing membrane protein [Synechococcales bacterium]